MPAVIPAELWKETGRWQKLRRHSCCASRTARAREFASARRTRRSSPTSCAARCKQLPRSCRRTSTRSRRSSATSSRPRVGLMRGREFIMKDAYSFDVDDEDAQRELRGDVRRVHAHLQALRARRTASSRRIPAPSAARSRTSSRCSPSPARTRSSPATACDYAANVEKAEVRAPARRRRRSRAARRAKVRDARQAARIDDVAAFLEGRRRAAREDAGLPRRRQAGRRRWCAATTTSTRSSSQKRARRRRGVPGQRRATSQKATGAAVGFAGPVGFKGGDRRRSRRSRGVRDCVTGANETDQHLTGVNLGRDCRRREFVDIRLAAAGDALPALRGGHAQALPRHRGRPRLHPRHEVLAADGRDVPRRRRQGAADRDGLLRHRRHAHRRRGDRAEPRRRRHRLADAASRRTRCARARLQQDEPRRRDGRRSSTTSSTRGRHRGALGRSRRARRA